MSKPTVGYLDPAWRYTNVRTGGSHKSGAQQKYQTMSIDEICAMPISEVLADSSVLFLWATVPIGDFPFRALRAWDYTYKTKFFWHKRILVPGVDDKPPTKIGRKGTGYWLTGETEELFIAVRGDVKAWRSGIDNWIETHRHYNLANELPSGPSGLEQVPGEHSEKPEEVIRLIEALTPNHDRIEFFATHHSAKLAAAPTSGKWDCYGLDLGHDFTKPEFWAGLRELQDVA